MAFLRPENLKALTLHRSGAVDNVADAVLGFNRGSDMDIFYIDVFVDDANATFDQTAVTLEYDDGASGADTVVDVITVAANTRFIGVDRDALTNSKVPSGSRFLLNVADVSTGGDLAITLVIWYVDGAQAANS